MHIAQKQKTLDYRVMRGIINMKIYISYLLGCAMIYDFIIKNYKEGEPIFLYELPVESKGYLRQEMKALADDGKLERLYNGVYYLPYVTLLGTKGKVSIEHYIDKKYLNAGGKPSGYITGLQLANQYGFTTQVPSCYEVCSNEATTQHRKQEVDGHGIIVYKPVTQVTAENKSALQFLDLMSNIDKYSELKDSEQKKRLSLYTEAISLSYDAVKTYLPLYPDRVYRNIYNAGLMNKLV